MRKPRMVTPWLTITKIRNRIGTIRRGIAQDRAEHALDPIGHAAAAFAERHRGEELALEPLVLFVMLELPREDLRQVLVGDAVEQPEVHLPQLDRLALVEPG